MKKAKHYNKKLWYEEFDIIEMLKEKKGRSRKVFKVIIAECFLKIMTDTKS
jgi:hypothetical protein